MTSREKTIKEGLPNVFVLPQIVPLLKEEEYVSEETLNRNKFSKRTSRNFRNNLFIHKGTELFKRFERIIEETWGGIKIADIYKSDNTMVLQLRDRDFVTEIYNMGHGVQMWLQTMWFITCVGLDSIVVLDEPDVYMHADLQRRLIRLLKNRFNQTIIATHSVEIMSEVQPNNILIINRKNNESIFANNYPVLQTAISTMGSIHNLCLSRILNNNKFIFVEGNDKEILNILYDILFPDIAIPLDHIASVPTGGWGSWDLKKSTARSLSRELKGLKVYFLYDKDYHTDEEIKERKEDALTCNVNLYIWNKKEIENYLVIPQPIARYIKMQGYEEAEEKITERIIDFINDFCEQMKEQTLDCFIDAAKKTSLHKKKEYSTIKNEIRPNFEIKWSDFNQKIGLVSGKLLMSHLSDKCKTVFDVSFGCKQIALGMKESEISLDIKMFLSAIRDGKDIK